MKLTHSYKNQGKEYAIAEAVEIECEPYIAQYEEQDEAMVAQEAAEKNRQFLGKLVELLHTKKILTDDEILGLLGNYSGWSSCSAES